LVLCGAAFHWFNAEEALNEFNRILKPTGKMIIFGTETLLGNIDEGFKSVWEKYGELLDEESNYFMLNRADFGLFAISCG